MQVRQNLDGSPSLASGFLVDDNHGSLSPYAPGAGEGISFEDFAGIATKPGGSVLWATRNRLPLSRGGTDRPSAGSPSGDRPG